jgi:ribosomal protein S18 acetylase RimI-like enzyme
VRDGVTIRPGARSDLPALEPQWTALYAQQRGEGMVSAIPTDGFRLWAASLEPVLGRLACLFVAEEAGSVVGFAAGRVRAHPSHFGGQLVGYLSEIFVTPAMRGGTGTALLERCMSWFADQGLSRVELQVAVRNEAAQGFYRRHGFVTEFVQMVAIPPRPAPGPPRSAPDDAR